MLGITADNFDNLWILIVIASAFPMITLIFVIVIPSNFDVNEEIEKYFKQKKKQQRATQSGGILNRSQSFIRVKSNLRDEMEND